MILLIRFVVYLFLILIIFLLGVDKYNKNSKPYRVLTVLFGLTLISEMFSRIIIDLAGKSMPVYHVFVPVQFLLLSLVYYYFSLFKRRKIVYIVLVTAFLLFCFLNVIYFQTLNQFPSNTLLCSSMVMVLLALLSLKKIFDTDTNRNLFQNPAFLFNCAILLFYTTTFLFWSFYNILIRSHISTKPFATVIYFVNILFYLILGYSAFLDRKSFPRNELQ